MPSWIPGPWAPVGEVDWEAYKRRINGVPDSPHQASNPDWDKGEKSAPKQRAKKTTASD